MNLNYYKNCLEKAGVKFEKGLLCSEIERIESKFEFRFPPDLVEFLQFALPIGHKFPDWRNDKDEEIKSRLDWVFEGMCFDIENNVFWLDGWGEKPQNLTDAFEIARLAIEKAPKLIPIYSHRYIPDTPNESGNPIFSVYQTDIIIYGVNLSTYLENEFSYYFETERRLEIVKERKIEFWSEIID